jgi:hypothetical protein
MNELLAEHGSAVAQVASLFFGPAAATWLVLKVRLNGVREDVGEIKVTTNEICKAQADHERRIYLLEAWLTKLPCVQDPKQYWEEHARIKGG